jgi:indolepyruvate ferredoxin oxidoreductase beta subunit
MGGRDKMNEKQVKAILLVGVGGQGTILASKILSDGFVSAGFDVKMSEIHGMSQRGGSVSTQIRFGDEVHSPIIGEGEASVIVAFEKMEALRWLTYLRPGGRIIVNDYEIPSVPILMGAAKYPGGIIEELKAKADALVIAAGDIAEGLGNAKAMNIVLLGAAVRAMEGEGLSGIDWRAIIQKNVKPAFLELNLKAFEAGYM